MLGRHASQRRQRAAEAAERGHAWLARLRTIVFLGTPHDGAPLERGGSWVDQLLSVSPYSSPLARLGMLRSAGITDLRHGNVRREDWHGRGRFERAGDRRPPQQLRQRRHQGRTIAGPLLDRVRRELSEHRASRGTQRESHFASISGVAHVSVLHEHAASPPT